MPTHSSPLERFVRAAGSDLLHEIVGMLPAHDRLVLRSVNRDWRAQIALTEKRQSVTAFGNSLARAQWIISQGFTLKRKGLRIAIGAANVGNLNVLNWIWNTRQSTCYSSNNWPCCAAVPYDHLELCCAAVLYGHLDVFEWCVEKKIFDITHSSVMRSAARGGHMGIIKRLRELGDDLTCSFVVGAAAAGGHAALVDWLISEGAKVSHRLMVNAMARNGHLEMLAAHVAKVNSGDFGSSESDGFALVSTEKVLHFAASAGQLHVIEWLQTLPNPTPLKTSDALATAIAEGHTHVVSWLHGRGCRSSFI
jgi:hypothetical protein